MNIILIIIYSLNIILDVFMFFSFRKESKLFSYGWLVAAMAWASALLCQIQLYNLNN